MRSTKWDPADDVLVDEILELVAKIRAFKVGEPIGEEGAAILVRWTALWTDLQDRYEVETLRENGKGFWGPR